MKGYNISLCEIQFKQKRVEPIFVFVRVTANLLLVVRGTNTIQKHTTDRQ
jgi:hypothetical protein